MYITKLSVTYDNPISYITRDIFKSTMVDNPPPPGTTGPIAYPAGDIASNLMSGTADEDKQAESRPSSSTTAVQNNKSRSNHSHSGHDGHQPEHGIGEDALRFPPALRTMTSTGKPYSSFSRGTKWFIVTLAGIAAVFSPIRYVQSFTLNHGPYMTD